MNEENKKYYDAYSFIVKERSLNEKFLKNKIREKWNEIFNNSSISLKRKKKEFKEQFIKFVKDEILNKYPFTLQCKLLKIYECYEEQLKNFAKNELRRGNQYPEVPTAKEIYKELFLQNDKINLKEDLEASISEDFLKFVNIADSSNGEFPYYSVYIQIKFKLKKPYLNKDDDEFYIIDNPIVKDKVFKLPMVRATTWKGALRFAAIKVFEDWIYEKLNKSKLDKEEMFKERARIVMLFGNEKDAHEDYLGKLCLLAIEGKVPTVSEAKKKIEDINKEFEKWLVKNGIISKEIPSRSGRLFFYPSFFDEISLDVITPLKRETKTPERGPIYFEIVPENAIGIFRLLYYPFDLIARGEFGKIEYELKEDMEFLAKTIRKMLCEIGFSAKKTSGFGVAEIVNVNVVCGAKLNDYSEEYKRTFMQIFGKWYQ